MKTLDDLLIQRSILKQLIRMAKLLGGKISIGDDVITLTELNGMLTELKIEIGSRRSQMNLKVINNNYGSN
jgi:hypothetical protein